MSIALRCRNTFERDKMRSTVVKTIVMLVTLAMCGLSGCDKAPNRIRIGYIPIADCAQLYVAVEKGYFQEQNLDVELVKLGGGAKILEALAGGSVEIGFSNVVSLILSHEAGLGFKAITGGPRANLEHRETGLLVMKGSGIDSLKQLEGKKVAVNTKKNIVELLLLAFLRKNNVNTSSIDFVEVPFPQMLPVLETGTVNAVATIEPFLTFGLQSEATTNLGHYFTEALSELEISTYNASTDWISSNPAITERFRSAMRNATDFCDTNPEELRTIVSEYTSLTPQQVAQITLPYYGFAVDTRSLDTIISLVHSEGWTDTNIRSSALVAE